MSKQKETLFQIPAVITKYTTLTNGGLKLQINTQEGVSDLAVSKLHKCLEKFGWLTFNIESKIKPEDLIDLPDIKPEFKNEKSPSEKQRNIIYRIWENNTNKNIPFPDYYKSQMFKLWRAL